MQGHARWSQTEKIDILVLDGKHRRGTFQAGNDVNRARSWNPNTRQFRHQVTAQIEEAVSTANRMLGRLKKALPSQSCYLWHTLYVTYIRPHLEFAIQAWSPNLETDIKILKRAHDRTTKVMTSIKHLPYTVRLERLRLTTLETRRSRGDLIEQYKIKSRMVFKKSSSWFLNHISGVQPHTWTPNSERLPRTT